MTIGLNNKEELRVTYGTHECIEDVFININAVQNADDEHYTEGLSVSAFEMHQIFFIRKERTYKLFSFRKEDKVHLSDFGFYADGEVLFSNSFVVDDKNENEDSFQKDTDYCPNCDKDTEQIVYFSDHERDSSGDYKRCLNCGWEYSGYTGEYHPPIKDEEE